MSSRRFKITVTTNGAQAATVYSPYLSGRLISVQYVKTDYADGSTFTITSEATGETLWTEAAVNASTVRRPRAGVHSTAGVAALYAAAGEAVTDLIRLSRDRIKIVIAAGGVTKTGTFYALVED